MGRPERDVATAQGVTKPRGPLFSACAWAAFLVPLGFALSHLDGAERWQQDTGVVQALDLVQVGADGVVSGALGAALSLLPIGTLLLRLSLLGALMVGVAGCLSFLLAHRSLARAEESPARTMLALSGALAAVLGSSWQSSAVTVGGQALAAVLALGFTLWLLHAEAEPSARRRWLGHGVWLGLLLLEAREVGVASALVLAMHTAFTLRLPRLADLGYGLIALATVWAIGVLPSLLESGASGLAFGLDLALPHGVFATSSSPLDELGPYLLSLSILGALGALRMRAQRLAVGGLLSWVVVDLAIESPALHLVAVAGLGASCGLGFVVITESFERWRIPQRRTLVQVLGVAHLCALLLMVEGAERESRQRTLSATRQWTEEAFESLPARSLLLVSSPEAAWRLWSARLTSGIRPDVVLVPTSLLSHHGWAAELLQLEPKLGPLIRDVAVRGIPSEYALTELADARPLRVEVDRRWNKLLLRHLSADGLWFRFTAHATGRTDRQQAQSSSRHSTARVWRAANTPRGRDEATLERLRHDVRQQAEVAAVLGDREVARDLNARLERLGPSSKSQPPRQDADPLASASGRAAR